jgi:hypothetical protein
LGQRFLLAGTSREGVYYSSMRTSSQLALDGMQSTGSRA